MIIKLCIDSAPAQPLEEGMQVVEAPDKISKENSKEEYAQALVKAVEDGKGSFAFYVPRLSANKKTAKLTGEALREMLFDVEWHCSDTGLAADGFQVLLLFPDEETRTFYGKSLRKMGIPFISE